MFAGVRGVACLKDGSGRQDEMLQNWWILAGLEGGEAASATPVMPGNQ